MDETAVNAMSSLALAHVGDGVYELMVRTRLARAGGLRQDTLHRDAVRYVSAVAQSKAAAYIRPSLTANERETLPMGAKLMTLECGIRFLADYLVGDTYFRIHRPDHNLDRCRTQFKLGADMEAKWAEMTRIVSKA